MSNHSTSGAAADEVSIEEARDLLVEVLAATDPSTDLHEFAAQVSQLLNLRQSRAEDEQLGSFLEDALNEIRSLIGNDQSSSEPLQSLRAKATDQWGELLEELNAFELGSDSALDQDAWDQLDDGLDGDDEDSLSGFSQDADVVAPSADEINSLISQLGQPSPAPTEFPSTPPEIPADRGSEGSAIGIESLDPELREAFLDDAAACVGSIEQALLQLESDPQHADSLNQILRELHTLKGASASVGLTDMADHLHALEDRLRDDQAARRAVKIDDLLKSVDKIRAQIAGQPHDAGASSAPENQSAATEPTSPSAAAVAPAASPTPSPSSFSEGPADDESVRVKSSQLNRLMDMLAELVMLRNRRDTELGQLHEVYHELIGSVSKMRLLSSEGEVQSTTCSSLQLSEIANDVLEVAQNVRDCARPVAEGNAAVSQFIRQFRQELVELRRTPISGLVQRLQRVVRDAAKAESKEVQLKLIGEDAGIERTLQQRLYEPLLHIVRNAVCHGIESPEERGRCGKPAAGTISLEAKSGPDLLVIEIRDDGRGLDFDAIRRRGIERGLLAPDQAATRDELSQLIFQPGFSTRQTTNQVAGRGVGMDVVAATLERMRGWLEVDSEPQRGTRIRLSFPLPSLVQHAMVFRSAGQLFALPMQSVQSAGEGQSGTLELPFSELLDAQQAQAASDSNRIVLACDAPVDADEGSGRVTLLVDEIVGPEEVVVRPLPPLMRQHPFCCGATLSGMGETVLLLDARQIVETQREQLRRADPASAPAAASRPTSPVSARPRVLVVDDSLSARKRVVRSLGRYPVEVVEASDGKQALEILQTQRFTAIFSDMEMPHVSGMELLAEVQSRHSEDSPPVVIISSRGETEFTERAKELGAKDYLIKPLKDEALDGALASMPTLRKLLPTSTEQLHSSGETP